MKIGILEILKLPSSPWMGLTASNGLTVTLNHGGKSQRERDRRQQAHDPQGDYAPSMIQHECDQCVQG